jgi:hypothetical protein
MFDTKLGAKTCLLVVLCGATVVASGCDRRDREERARKEVAQEVNEANKEIGEAQENLAEQTLDRERAEYREAVNGTARDDRRSARRDPRQRRSTPGIKDAYDADLDSIDDNIKRVKDRLEDADDVTVAGWATYRTEVDAMMSTLESSVENLEQRIKSTPST